MMATYHIHIKGLVQGVGFRPFVYRLAKQKDVKGWVNNTANGVHILATADEEVLEKFYHEIITHPPVNAKITSHHAALISPQQFADFHIHASENHRPPDLLMTPDFGLCANCRAELFDVRNRRYRYPFITCTDCGPRYSIIEKLPYDRDLTTMAPFEQCWQCRLEFHDPENRRYFSQTNSCADCGIPMKLQKTDGEIISKDYGLILSTVADLFGKGEIIAVKGIGGYLLMCDATNETAIAELRKRKHRPAKPLALLYANIEMAEQDVELSEKEKNALQSVAAPIVLCRLKEQQHSGIQTSLIAPGLSRIGIMLPYSPLLALLSNDFNKPLVATSGNISGSPILTNDKDALHGLSSIASYMLSYEREIVVPQDDSVIQFSSGHQQQIILRRSRGLAPNYFQPSFTSDIHALAMGAEMKSSFALLQNDQCYVSQYLGDQESYEAQNSFRQTMDHLAGVLKFQPELILVDAHPGYNISMMGKELAQKHQQPVYEVQHHKAHFAAVLAENDLCENGDPVLGVVWDGTGYGEDTNIWGGEFFIYDEGEITRVAHFDYFPVLAGDKMAREPRLSALSLLSVVGMQSLIKEKFSEKEWNYYVPLIEKDTTIKTSSAGRLLDGVAALLDICDRSSFESEAAMLLESRATKYNGTTVQPYQLDFTNGVIYWQSMIRELLSDIDNGNDTSALACKIHLSLARLITDVAHHFRIRKIALGGGVFQNALLNDLMYDQAEGLEIYCHQQLSPNDECISFGQLAFMHLLENKEAGRRKKLELLT